MLLHLGLALTPSDPIGAVACYRKALEIPLDTRISLGARLNLAARLMEQGDLDEAIALTQTATQRAPEVALGWYNLGLMQRRRGDIAAALEAYSRAMELDPDNAACHQNRAVALLLGGDIEGARAAFRTRHHPAADSGATGRSPGLAQQGPGHRQAGHGAHRLSQPLQNRTVVVTRAADQQGEARRLLEAGRAGARPPRPGDRPPGRLGTAG